MSKKKRTPSSTRWLKEHFDDKYVQKAQKLGLRSRAVFKIDEIQLKDKLIKPGMTVETKPFVPATPAAGTPGKAAPAAPAAKE